MRISVHRLGSSRHSGGGYPGRSGRALWILALILGLGMVGAAVPAVWWLTRGETPPGVATGPASGGQPALGESPPPGASPRSAGPAAVSPRTRAGEALSAGRYAVLAGVKEYHHPKLPKLDFTENDVAELAKILRSQKYEVVLLCDTAGMADKELRPTKANIERELKAVLGKCRKGDLVLLAFSGHGVQFDGQADNYFCPQDAKPFSDQTDTLLSLKGVYEELDRSFAGAKVLLVDACRDDPGASRGVDGDSAPRPPTGVAALFSCSAGERAFESAKLGHGVFFHYVLEGLRGKAAEPDGEVSFGSLSTYVRKQVARNVTKFAGPGFRQSPNLKADLQGASPVLVRVAVADPRPGEPKREGRLEEGPPPPRDEPIRTAVVRLGAGPDVVTDEIYDDDNVKRLDGITIREGTPVEVLEQPKVGKFAVDGKVRIRWKGDKGREYTGWFRTGRLRPRK